MATAKEYRKRAEECLELARVAEDEYARQAMEELAQEFNRAADRVERYGSVRPHAA
jgi:hypothetical protein